jgi:hypothetical protein
MTPAVMLKHTTVTISTTALGSTWIARKVLQKQHLQEEHDVKLSLLLVHP